MATFTFKWDTGKIELAAEAVLAMPAAQLSTFIKTATVNREEVKAEIAAFIASELENYDPKVYSHKPIIERYNKLLSVCEGKKQSKRDKAIMRIVNNVADSRPQWAGVFQDAGKYCVCDGYRMIRSAAALDGFKSVSAVLDTTKAIGSIRDYTVKLVLPTVKELKQDMKIAKLAGADAGNVHVRVDGKRMDFVYDFGVGLPMVNAKYLVDMLEALPECESFARPDKTIAPIYFVSGEDDGILLPVRKTSEEARKVDRAEYEAKQEAERAERLRREEQERIEREQEIETAIAQAEQKIISSGYIENENIYGKLLFLRLFDKYGVKVPIRTRGWIINKLVAVNQHSDGGAQVFRNVKSKNEKISDGFCAAYWNLRNILIAESEKAESEAATPAAVDHEEALARVETVAAAVRVNEAEDNITGVILRQVKREMFTEDEAKRALLFPVSVSNRFALALPAHEEAAQDVEAVSSAAVINPAFLRACKGRYEIIYNPGYPDTTSGMESLIFAFCEVLHKPRYKNSS